MIKSLLNGIGGYSDTNQFYDNWSTSYEKTLSKWNYQAPLKSSLILKSHLNIVPKTILDLACGTGLFGIEVLKLFPNSKIDGMDISKKILIQAKKKNLYNNLYCSNFDKKIIVNKKYDLISCIGAMTYTKKPLELLLSIHKVSKKKGFFIFTHRVDLWKKEKYSDIIKSLNKKWQPHYISRPILYLPNNKEFGDKIKIKIVLLKKN